MMMVVLLMQQELKQQETATKCYFPRSRSSILRRRIGRSLIVEGTEGDATLLFYELGGHSVKSCYTKALLHWQKTWTVQENHPSIGAGVHKEISTQPYTFQVFLRL
jgi:alpha-amylase